jgi:two-component system, NtrC family, sensor kinase
MDLPLRSRLLIAVVGIVALWGLLTIVTGSFLINRMVIAEAQRRVALALKTADAMLERRLEEALKACLVMSEQGTALRLSSSEPQAKPVLEELRKTCGYDFLHVLDARGVVQATARGNAAGTQVTDSPVVRKVLRERTPVAAVSLLPLKALTLEDEALARRTEVRILPTPHAKPGGPARLTEVMILEAASPIFDEQGNFTGIVRGGTVLNRNFDFVDFVRENIFTAATYEKKSLGTVTIFQSDARITTNVKGPGGERAVGTRVSEEVYEQVLGEGKTWTGPAFVVDSWYISAYKPLKDVEGRVLGMLYVGVLKKRYDDMRNQAMGLFILVVAVTFVGAILLSFWLAARLTRPLTRLTAGAVEVTQGNLDYQLPSRPRAERDEINRLTLAFNQMVSALKERNEQLRSSRDDLQRTATELQQWVKNYLDALEFINHELKNQIAAMKINLLAVRDGYVGKVTQDQREALEDVGQAILRAEEMILNYLNLSRIERGELQVRARPLHVENDVVRPLLGSFRGRLDAKGMRIEVEMEEDLFVQADPSLLQIVYENLLNNAVKYGREGGLVRITGARWDGTAELHVWNDGPGVPPDQVDALFGKFYRLRNLKEKERGTGLGLFIAREVVKRHGGNIRAESVLGSWIDFIFTLPVPNALLPAEGERAQQRAGGEGRQ